MKSIIGINVEKFISDLDNDGRFKLSDGEKENIDSQVQFHLGHVTGIVLPRETHEKITRAFEPTEEDYKAIDRLSARRTR